MAVNLLGKAEWISNKASKLMCFDGQTYIKIQTDNKKTILINPGPLGRLIKL